MEKDLEKLIFTKALKPPNEGPENVVTDEVEAEQVLSKDDLFRALVVQRSRAYVKRSQEQYGGSQALFPERKDPQVIPYSVKKTYGNLLKLVDQAFNKEKALFSRTLLPACILQRPRKHSKASRTWTAKSSCEFDPNPVFKAI